MVFDLPSFFFTSAPPLLGPQLVLSGVVALGSKDTGRHHLRSGTSEKIWAWPTCFWCIKTNTYYG